MNNLLEEVGKIKQSHYRSLSMGWPIEYFMCLCDLRVD